MNPKHPADAALLDFKSALRQAMQDHDVDQHDLAEVCLVDPSMVSRWCSRKCRDAIGAEHIALAAERFPELAFDLVSWIAQRANCAVAPKRAVRLAQSSTIFGLLRDFHREGAELSQALMAGLSRESDDEEDLTDHELETVDRELRDVEQIIQEARRLVDAEKASRGEVHELARHRAQRSKAS